MVPGPRGGRQAAVTPAGEADTGRVFQMTRLGSAVLIWARNGLFVARGRAARSLSRRPARPETGQVFQMRDSAGGLLISAERGLFFAREQDGKVTIAPAGANTGPAQPRASTTPGGGDADRGLGGMVRGARGGRQGDADAGRRRRPRAHIADARLRRRRADRGGARGVRGGGGGCATGGEPADERALQFGIGRVSAGIPAAGSGCPPADCRSRPW